jgi:TPR repeat protein
MANFDELEQKLRTTRDDLEKVGKDVRKFLEIKDALQSSDASLKTSSDNLARLATSSEENAQALRECIYSLTDAVKTLSQIDIVDFNSARASFQTEVFDTKDKIDKLSQHANELPKKVHDAARAGSERTDRLLTAASRREWFLAVAVIILLAASLYGFYLDHGLPGYSGPTPEVETKTTAADLAGHFISGPVAQQDYAEAARLYRLAAEEGNAHAQNNLGALFLLGRGVNKNLSEAARWFRLGADQGLAEAQHNMGSMYVTGEGFDQNGSEAVKWWLLAAEQGYPDSLYNLGVAYFDGFGVEEDHALAGQWYEVAAEQGHAEAQLRFGMMLLEGDSIEQNAIEGYKWLTVSSQRFSVGEESLRDTALDRRNDAKLLMGADDIAVAEELAADWAAK